MSDSPKPPEAPTPVAPAPAWMRSRGPIPLQLAVSTFSILALELALIRWSAGQVRMLAYFSNLVLIAAFLGMGLGVGLGRRRPNLLHWTLPALAVMSALLAFSEPLGLIHMKFPDLSTYTWGAEGPQDLLIFVKSLGSVFALFLGIAGIFVFAGIPVGNLFGRLPTLTAYSWDLGGSLAGVLAFAGLTATGVGPMAWLALGVLPQVWLSRSLPSVLAAVAVLGLGAWSGQGALFSAYNRIDIAAETGGTGERKVSVNRDYHQYIRDLSDDRMADPALAPQSRATLAWLRKAYELPFALAERQDRVLVVGAGTGNDVQAALRMGAGEVHAVDIDARLIELGRRLHPEKPYDDPRVKPVVDDARAFFEQYDGPGFDVVAFGLLDSHAMFSSMSSLRLENYVYTEEGFRSAWSLVGEGGLLAVSFCVFGGEWLSDRMYWTLARATGVRPTMIHHGMDTGRTFVAARPGAVVHWERAEPFARPEPRLDEAEVTTTSDDWPFLYSRPDVFPAGTLLLFALILATASLAIRAVFGAFGRGGGFDAPLFLMGAAFLLIETRGVTHLSLLFGSTWVVNAAVFAGILVMVLAANLAVVRWRPQHVRWWFLPLFAALALNVVIDPGLLNGLGLVPRGILGGLLNGLPIGFAGIVVSLLLARSPNAATSLGSNLLGSVLGGCLEYLSVLVGLRSLVLLAGVLYATAFLLLVRRPPSGDATAAGG